MSFYIRDSWPPMAVANGYRGRGSAGKPPRMPGAGQATGGKLPGSKAIEGWRALFGSGWEGTAGRGLEPGLSGARFARVWSAGPELAPGRRAAGAGCPGGEGDSGPQRVAPGRVSRARAARPAGCVLQSGPCRIAGQSAPIAELSGGRCDKRYHKMVWQVSRLVAKQSSHTGL